MIVVCAATGPSLRREDLDSCRDAARVMAISNAYEIAPWADWLYACDPQWWHKHIERTADFRGQRYGLNLSDGEQFGVKSLRGVDGYGLCREQGAVSTGGDLFTGGHSGAQAINLAYHFGAKRIVLLGYDMGATGCSHFFGEHDGLRNTDADTYAKWCGWMATLASDLQTEGIQVINASRETALTCFERRSLQEALRE